MIKKRRTAASYKTKMSSLKYELASAKQIQSLLEITNKILYEAVQELHETLSGMYNQHGCTCDHPSCNRCQESTDVAEVLAKYKPFDTSATHQRI